MKGKRLGRGLEEISHIFLSSEGTESLADLPSDNGVPEAVSPGLQEASVRGIGMTAIPGLHLDVFALCNVSIELARQGYRVLVVDDDPGGRNVTRLMGLMDVQGQAEPIMNNAPMGVRLIYRTSFLNDLLSLRDNTRYEGQHIYLLPEKYQRFDFILFHLPYRSIGDMGPILRHIARCLFIAPTDGEGLLATYKAIKKLNQEARQVQVGATIFSPHGETEAVEAFQKLGRNVKNFLKKEILSYSFLSDGGEVEESIEDGIPLVLKWPSSDTRRHLFNIASLIVEDTVQERPSPGARDAGN